MERFNFRVKGKLVKMEVKVCRSFFSKFSGLMFRKNSPPLLFVFGTSKRRAIHSFFCRPFIAVWFVDDKIVDARFVKSNIFSVKPRGNFDKLLEIPDNSKYFGRAKNFLDGQQTFKY